MWNSLLIFDKEGDTVEDDREDMNEKLETISVAFHVSIINYAEVYMTYSPFSSHIPVFRIFRILLSIPVHLI